MLMHPVGKDNFPWTPSEFCYGTMPHFKCTIELDENCEEIRTNFDVIQGKIHFYQHQKLHDLFIQLEGWTITFFKTRAFYRQIDHFEQNEFLSLSSSSLNYKFIGREEPCTISLPETPQWHSLPFAIELNGLTNFPPSAASLYGQIQYKLAVYGSCNPTWVEGGGEMLAEKILGRVNGNLSFLSELMGEPKLGQPLWLTKEKKVFSFFFNNRNAAPTIKSSFWLDQRGFEVGRKVAYKFTVNCGQVVNRLVVSLIQKIIYYAKTARKFTSTVLVEKENINFTPSGDGTIEWFDAIQLDDKLIPTFKLERKSIEILYFLQYTVDLKGGSKLTDEAEILICTKTISLIEIGNLLRRTTLSLEEDSNEEETNSIQMDFSLPPPYSDLNGRLAVDTLPPAYEEIFRQNLNEDP